MEKSASFRKKMCGNQRGAILVMVAIFFVIFVGLLALAIDINHLYVVRNELQNAADAGALAGAKALYEDVDGPGGGYEPGEKVNTNANSIAKTVGEMNTSDHQPDGSRAPVEINWTSGNTGDAQRGHWSFANRKFTPLDTEDPANIWGVPDADLDLMDGTYQYPPGSGLYPQNVNAVKVIARRNDIEAESFFAKVYNFLGFKMQAEAVAYIGFSGSLGPLDADMPIALCDTALSNGDCNIGRMINSAKDPSDSGSTSNTGAWANMAPEDDTSECGSGTNTNAVSPLVDRGCACADPAAPDTQCGVNDDQIGGGDWLGANGGMLQKAYNDMQSCYEYNTGGNHPWEMTLPVIRCDGGNIENCAQVISAVTVNMLFMSDSNPTPDETPNSMTKPDADNFPDWDATDNGLDTDDCAFFYQLAGGIDVDGNPVLDSDGNPIQPFYNAALLTRDPPIYDTLTPSTQLGDNSLATVLPYLPLRIDEDGNVIDNDPWLIEDRWKTVSPVGLYTPDKARWDCFVDHFNLINSDGNMAPMAFKSMYFMPDCEYHEPKGTTNGPNFGVRAKYPVLVD